MRKNKISLILVVILKRTLWGFKYPLDNRELPQKKGDFMEKYKKDKEEKAKQQKWQENYKNRMKHKNMILKKGAR